MNYHMKSQEYEDKKPDPNSADLKCKHKHKRTKSEMWYIFGVLKTQQRPLRHERRQRRCRFITWRHAIANREKQKIELSWLLDLETRERH